jgi:hypothetical protein
MKTIPHKDSDFNEVQNVISSKALANIASWNLDGVWITSSFIPAKTKWNTRWDAYQNPVTRTPLITFEKNEARKEYESLLRKLVQNLEHNTKVTEDDLREMGIVPPNPHRTPIPAPTTYPDYTVDSSVIRRLSIHFRDHDSEHKAKPHGVQGAVVRWAILDTPPAVVDDITNTVLDSASPYTLEFSEAQRGKTVYICLAWQNAKGEKGPWGEIVNAIVP